MSKEQVKVSFPRFTETNGFTTTESRSQLMSRIRGKNTQPEIALRKALWKSGVRFRLHGKTLKGKPDIVIKSKRTLIFIDGDFWHGKNWAVKKQKIKANRGFWIPKIERTIQRDLQTTKLLQGEGWRVLRFWESDVKNNLDDCVQKVMHCIDSPSQEYLK